MSIDITTLSVICVTSLLIYTAIYWYFKLHGYPPWGQYVESLYHLGVFIALISFFLDQIIKKKVDTEKSISDIVHDQELGFIDIEQHFLDNYPVLFPLYKELNQQNKIIQKIPNPKNIDPIKRLQSENNMCNIILQRIENIYLAELQLENFQNSEQYQEWIKTWKQWFRSPTLTRVWNTNKYTFFSKNILDFLDGVVRKNDEAVQV